MVEALPVVLRHKPKGTEQRPAEVVEVCVAVIRIRTSDYASIIDRALTARQTRPRDKISYININPISVVTYGVHCEAQCSKTKIQIIYI